MTFDISLDDAALGIVLNAVLNAVLDVTLELTPACSLSESKL